MQSVMYIHCCNRAELARCVETTVCHNCAQQTGTIDTCQGANAHWAMPHLSGRRSSLLKRVRFGYGSLTNLFSTTLSIQANSRVLTLTVSAKRKPVHSSYRDVTTKSERVIAHVIGSNLLCVRREYANHVNYHVYLHVRTRVYYKRAGESHGHWQQLFFWYNTPSPCYILSYY